MKKTDFTDLHFFARHFNVDASKLEWCILEKKEGAYSDYMLGLRFGSSRAVICVDECKLRRLKRGKLLVHAAVLRKNKSRFCLRSSRPVHGSILELSFTKTDLQNIYRDKWSDESLEAH